MKFQYDCESGQCPRQVYIQLIYNMFCIKYIFGLVTFEYITV